MTPQTFSLEMCRLLSSLVPEFEGHYWWVRKAIFKAPKFAQSEAGQYLPEEEPKIEYVLTCHEVPAPYSQAIPVWQVEDILKNLKTLAPYIKHQDPVPVEIFFKPKVTLQEYTICCNHSIKEYVLPWEIMVSELTSLLVMYPDTAYQKIEEYLWSILK